MSEKLLSCPFCGGEAAVCDIKKPSVNGWVGCQRCRCFMDWVKDGKSLAIAAWNRRAQPENEPITNADRIRGMSDEDLAEFLATVKCRGAAAEACDMFWEDDSYSIDWLRQPSETEGKE